MSDARPTVRLIGEDGNAFMILGLCIAVARNVGWDDARLAAFLDEAMNGDYAHLIATVDEYFNIT
jgi:hypothetical protein